MILAKSKIVLLYNCSLHKRCIILVQLNLKKRVVYEHISATEYIYCKSSYVSLIWALAWLFWLDFAEDQLRKNWPASKQLSKLCFVVAFPYYRRTKESIYQILDENKLNKKSLDCSWGMLSGKCLRILLSGFAGIVLIILYVMHSFCSLN